MTLPCSVVIQFVQVDSAITSTVDLQGTQGYLQKQLGDLHLSFLV